MPSIYTPLTPEQQRDKRLESQRRARGEARPLRAKPCACENTVTYEDMDGFRACVKCGREPR